MPESLSSKEQPPSIDNWKDVIILPIVAAEKPWNIDELEKILTDSIHTVAQQAIKDNKGKIFTTLSGGLDSSLCLAVIRNLYPDVPISTFTVGSSTKHPDVQFAKAVSFIFQTLHHEIIVDDKNKEKLTRDFQSYFGTSIEPKGNLNPWATYQEIKKWKAKSVIAHDGIDEQMGGYWPHRKYGKGSEFENKAKQEEEFEYFWSRLEPDHLVILQNTANHFGIKLLFPYLQKELVEYISHIPVEERAIKDHGKIIMRALAEKYLWKPIRERAKFGFGQALEDEVFIKKNLENQFKRY